MRCSLIAVAASGGIAETTLVILSSICYFIVHQSLRGWRGNRTIFQLAKYLIGHARSGTQRYEQARALSPPRRHRESLRSKRSVHFGHNQGTLA
jgi:hypothetical protein